MRLHCIFVPARMPEPAQTELNTLLASQRVLAVHREWLSDGAQSGWAFCVEVQLGPGPLPDALKAPGSAERRRGPDIDYRQVLPADDFACYARLRATRKQLAQRDGVPLYAVCNNEQMAAMATARMRSLAELAAIDGMGPARVARYLACWKAARGKRQRPAVAAYLAQVDERLKQLSQSILAGQAPLGISQHFLVHDPKRRGLAFCGYRVRQGVVLASGRKLRRARQQARRLRAAEAVGAPAIDLQRAAELHRAALLPAQTLHFRRALWWPDEAGSL